MTVRLSIFIISIHILLRARGVAELPKSLKPRIYFGQFFFKYFKKTLKANHRRTCTHIPLTHFHLLFFTVAWEATVDWLRTVACTCSLPVTKTTF